jgi:hypothetical protein
MANDPLLELQDWVEVFRNECTDVLARLVPDALKGPDWWATSYDIAMGDIPSQLTEHQRSQVRGVLTALTAIDEDLLPAVKSGDAATAALMGLRAGINIQYAWASQAKAKSEILAKPNRALGEKNRQAVLTARDNILKSDPNISKESLVRRIRKATGFGDRTIYKHLAHSPARR